MNELWIKVETRAAGSDQVESSKELNQYDRDDRVWLARHCWWAMHNGRSVTTYPV